ncbi:MAG: PP2C family protein-serine/threonine phosphatase [Acidobacteriota bacterium]
MNGSDSSPLAMDSDVEQPHVLACTEVWGGNRSTVRTVKLPSLSAWVCSSPLDSEVGGGDLHFFSVCDYDVLSRVALADVSGHGREVNEVTQKLHGLMRENVNRWDQSDFMRGLNQAFGRRGEGKYATAIVLSYNRVKMRLSFSNAGHLPPLWYHAGSRTWDWLEETAESTSQKLSGLPVGLIPGTDYRQTVVALEPLDLLVLYTDGLTEAENANGEDLGRNQLMEWARRIPVDSPSAAGRELWERLQKFRGSHRHDDETILVLQREQEFLPAMLGGVARSYVAGHWKKGRKQTKP